MPTNQEKLRIAARYVAASNAGDSDAVLALHAPEAMVWHNFDDADVSVERSMAVLRWLHRTVPDVRFADVRLVATDEGFVQRSILTGTAPDGSSVRAHSCIVATLDGLGRIVRVEEYVDSAQLGPLLLQA